VVKLPTWLVYAAVIAGGAEARAERRASEPAPPTAPGRPVVMLDPGHGGSNSGAASAGLVEKRLTLALADRVAGRLRARGVDARLTRTGDQTRTLRQRVELANRAPADLLVSIHANASISRSKRGFETYVLTAHAVDVDGRALRADAPTPRPGVDPDVALVLDDVERGAAQWAAADLAARMQRALADRRGAAGDRGVRQDAHHVLLGATMPAVLVEVGFLDHPLEGRELADPAVQDQLADALTEAILDQLAD
jgi:N-acetylmuramoyl-L-alanine amidase